VRKWTKSACVVFAWCIVAVPVTAPVTGSARSAQANQRNAKSITRVTLASTVELASLTRNPEISVSAPRSAQRKATATARSAVQPGDTLPLTLLAAGVLIATFAGGLVLLLARRRRRARETRKAVEKARIVLADYERLIVTYSVADDTVYVLTPPGEDPRAVLRAARLVLPDDTYEELAGHLGIPANWPLE
jgi:hypothetical protein